jgi:pimeloyl-ACP methyl ester carboxylesterase
VLAGELDPITPVAASEEIVASMPRGTARLETFPLSGHVISATEPRPLFSVLRESIVA